MIKSLREKIIAAIFDIRIDPTQPQPTFDGETVSKAANAIMALFGEYEKQITKLEAQNKMLWERVRKAEATQGIIFIAEKPSEKS